MDRGNGVNEGENVFQHFLSVSSYYKPIESYSVVDFSPSHLSVQTLIHSFISLSLFSLFSLAVPTTRPYLIRWQKKCNNSVVECYSLLDRTRGRERRHKREMSVEGNEDAGKERREENRRGLCLKR